MSAEWQFKVGTKATLILDSWLCGSLPSPRAVVYSARFLPTVSLFPPYNLIVAAPRLWNELPLEIRSAKTQVSLRKKLKTYIFGQAFPTQLLCGLVWPRR